ncbi:hypothetical protein ACFY0N_00680 [Streptomyces vinaceus]|uniref:hypothetical protein n=1 Tax=Streptomyces vinaceus TaxID=1960 RepID=UPI0036B32EDF
MAAKETAADLVAQAAKDYAAGAPQRDPAAIAAGQATAAKHLVEGQQDQAARSGR